MVSKDIEPNIDNSNKISFLNKNLVFDLFYLFHDRNKGDTCCTMLFIILFFLGHNFQAGWKEQEMFWRLHKIIFGGQIA